MDQYAQWIQQLKQKGMSDEDIGKFLGNVSKLSATDLYATIVSALTEEDVQELESIEEDKKAKQRIEELFTLRTGLTISDVLDKSQDAMVGMVAESPPEAIQD